jgi:hypothetical protein
VVLGGDRLDVVQPVAQRRHPGRGQAEDPLVGPVGLRDTAASHEPVRGEPLEHGVELAARRRPEEAGGRPADSCSS